MTPEQIRNVPELLALSEQLIAGFERVHRAAGKELQSPLTRQNPFVLAGVRKALQELQTVYTALRREPFLARVEVQWSYTGLREILYVCRGGAGGLKVPDLNGRLVSYKAELGKLAELDTGEEITLRLPSLPNLPSKTRDALVSARIKVKPRFAAEGTPLKKDKVELSLRSTA